MYSDRNYAYMHMPQRWLIFTTHIADTGTKFGGVAARRPGTISRRSNSKASQFNCHACQSRCAVSAIEEIQLAVSLKLCRFLLDRV